MADNLMALADKNSIRLFIAKWLIRFNKLKSAEYSGEQLSDLMAEHLPIICPVSAPAGEGSFRLLSASVCLPKLKSVIQVDVSSCFSVEYLAKALYRADLKLSVEAKPAYDISTKEIRLIDVKINEISLLHDEYSVLNDTRELINLVAENPLLSMFGDTVKSAYSLVTGSPPSNAGAYLQLYIGGSKQRILDYHKPQLQTIMAELLTRKNACYRLDESHFEERLFAEFGKEVVIEEGTLRFVF